MLLLSHNIFIGMVIQFFSVLWYETFQGLPSSSQTPGREHSCNILKKPNLNYLTLMILCLTWGLIKLSELNRRWISRSVSLPSQIFFSLHCSQRCCSERSLPINQSLVKLMEPSKASRVSLDPAPKKFQIHFDVTRNVPARESWDWPSFLGLFIPKCFHPFVQDIGSWLWGRRAATIIKQFLVLALGPVWLWAGCLCRLLHVAPTASVLL